MLHPYITTMLLVFVLFILANRSLMLIIDNSTLITTIVNSLHDYYVSTKTRSFEHTFPQCTTKNSKQTISKLFAQYKLLPSID